ncbi:MAG TPA: zinc ribbon domain-containing protein [Coleofasciculaceae cyanobacterium]|jgi:putative FmdB family regulatory protein
MPLYEFRCETCGSFEQWRTLAQVETPMLCPTCQAVAKRIFSPPSVNLNSGSLRLQGREAKEPRLVERSQDKEPATPKYRQPQHGRPWMISH